jgi:RNA-directed DNA polymerase
MQANRLANGTERPTEWNEVNWTKANRQVRNLRQRIFRATQAGDFKKVRSLQKLMLRSRANILVSVRRVTQTNAGRKTPGVDRVVVKTAAARGKLVDQLAQNQPWKAKPTRRVYIPKADGKKLRPLSIPVIKDRCLQAVVKNALEPSWESRFEGMSYGFRPGRSCHDAIQKIYGLARPNKTKKWILDADLRGAFDNISHEEILEAIKGFPGRELIRQWLKAGFMDKGIFRDTLSGVPQGGVVSPVLLNIALHGMEEALGITYTSQGSIRGKRAVVRYADDLVVFCESKEEAELAKQALGKWLTARGLSFAEEKTRIVHLREGFNFLGFNIRHYRKPLTTKTGWKLLIKPSKQSVQKIRERLRQEWHSLRGHKVQVVIERLNPIIRGWANYFRAGVAAEIFNGLDHWMFQREERYATHTHPKKSKSWKRAKYWGRLNLDRQDTMVFGDKHTGRHLLKFSWFPIEYPVLVKGRASPDDPKLAAYWKKRNAAKGRDLTPSKQKLAQRQSGVCPVCRATLFNEEELETHHVVPREAGGKDSYINLQLLHLFCHQQLHAQDKRERAKVKKLGSK